MQDCKSSTTIYLTSPFVTIDTKNKIFIFNQEINHKLLLKEGNLEHCDTKDFLLPFEKMVDYQVKCMLDPSTQNYRPYTKSELTPKNQYKKNTQRNIVFELDK